MLVDFSTWIYTRKFYQHHLLETKHSYSIQDPDVCWLWQYPIRFTIYTVWMPFPFVIPPCNTIFRVSILSWATYSQSSGYHKARRVYPVPQGLEHRRPLTQGNKHGYPEYCIWLSSYHLQRAKMHYRYHNTFQCSFASAITPKNLSIDSLYCSWICNRCVVRKG